MPSAPCALASRASRSACFRRAWPRKTSAASGCWALMLYLAACEPPEASAAECCTSLGGQQGTCSRSSVLVCSSSSVRRWLASTSSRPLRWATSSGCALATPGAKVSGHAPRLLAQVQALLADSVVCADGLALDAGAAAPGVLQGAALSRAHEAWAAAQVDAPTAARPTARRSWTAPGWPPGPLPGRPRARRPRRGPPP